MVDGRVPILLLGLAASVLPGAAGPGVAVDDRLRVTLAGTGRYAEATVVVNPPSSSGGRRVRGFGMGGLTPLAAFF